MPKTKNAAKGKQYPAKVKKPPRVKSEWPELIERLNKDLKENSGKMTREEARNLVDAYYMIQDDRIRVAGQLRAHDQHVDNAPANVLTWMLDNMERIEKQLELALKYYAEAQPMGRWAMSICGIGPVIAAGLLAHIDIEKAPTVGHIWSFAGLDPRAKWLPKTKRPWNASLKTLCWKMGESFVKVCNNDKDFYGKLLNQRKAIEQTKNDKLEFKDQAETKLKNFKIGKDTEAIKWYEKGMLPPGHIHARAKRWAVKIFLSHWHAQAYELHFGERPPEPYPIAQLQHAHKIEAPV